VECDSDAARIPAGQRLAGVADGLLWRDGAPREARTGRRLGRRRRRRGRGWRRRRAGGTLPIAPRGSTVDVVSLELRWVTVTAHVGVPWGGSPHLPAGQSAERGVAGDAETAGVDGPGPPKTHAIAQLATEPHFAMQSPHGAFLPISAITASLLFAAVLTTSSSEGVHTAPVRGAGAVETVPPPPPPAQEWQAN
jgi:hypothetical protein